MTQKSRPSVLDAQIPADRQLMGDTPISPVQDRSETPLLNQDVRQAVPPHANATPVQRARDTMSRVSPARRTHLCNVVRALLANNNTPLLSQDILAWITGNEPGYTPPENKRDSRISATLSLNSKGDKAVIEKLHQDHVGQGCYWRLRQGIQKELCELYPDLKGTINQVYSSRTRHEPNAVVPSITPLAQRATLREARLDNFLMEEVVDESTRPGNEEGLKNMANKNVDGVAASSRDSSVIAAGDHVNPLTEQLHSASSFNALVRKDADHLSPSYAPMWSKANQQGPTNFNYAPTGWARHGSVASSAQGETHQLPTLPSPASRSWPTDQSLSPDMESNGTARKTAADGIMSLQATQSSEPKDRPRAGELGTMLHGSQSQIGRNKVSDQESCTSSTSRERASLEHVQEQSRELDTIQGLIDDAEAHLRDNCDTIGDAPSNPGASGHNIHLGSSINDSLTLLGETSEAPSNQPETSMMRIWELFCNSEDISSAFRQYDVMKTKTREASVGLKQHNLKHEELRGRRQKLVAEIEGLKDRLRQTEDELEASDLAAQVLRGQLEASASAFEEAKKEGAQQLEQIWHSQRVKNC